MPSAQTSPNGSILNRLFSFTRPYRMLLATSAVLAVVLAPLGGLTPWLTHIMVDEYIMRSDLPGLQKMAFIFMGILIITTVLRYYFAILTNRLGQSVVKDIRLKVFKKIISFRLSYFDKSAVGTNTTRTINDLESVQVVFSEGLITIVADILSLLMVLLLMFYTSVMLTLITLISFPLLLIASYIFKEKVKESYQRVRNQVVRMNTFLQEHISGMKIVQVFTSEQKVGRKFKEINREYTQANLDGIFYYAVFFPVVEIISAASLGFMIWWGAQGVLDDKVTVGQLIAFPMFLARLFQPVRMLADKFNTLQMGLIAAGRVFQLLDKDETEQLSEERLIQKLKGKIEFRNVHFSYDGETPVLKNISFTLEPGHSLAIVGPTGSGKSSIISILNRLYEIKEGKILMDDQDICTYPLSMLRQRIGFVLQDVFLFNGTIRENISLYDPEIGLDKIQGAAKSIGADEFITRLPGGYNFKLAERGANLSLGQRQLISFVRALVAEPDILILDEATSSIDTQTEKIIQEAIPKMMKGRTSILIAHRLSTIRNSDQIIYLKNGEIKESGTQQELLSLSEGYFRRLYESHFQLAQAN
ncbi:MAG: ABC transporter ATP-binding protein [Saprospiraceae bacterium]|nr:ABC transporter ATP-binding protein [Saprospiraceae bacterium]